MRRYVVALALVVLSSIAQGRSLNGNLDYVVTTQGDEAFLVLTNKKPETPVVLEQVQLILPANQKHVPEPIGVFQGKTPISPEVRVSLGSVRRLVTLFAPDMQQSPASVVAASDGVACQRCQTRGIGLRIGLRYGAGTTQAVVTAANLLFYEP